MFEGSGGGGWSFAENPTGYDRDLDNDLNILYDFVQKASKPNRKPGEISESLVQGWMEIVKCMRDVAVDFRNKFGYVLLDDDVAELDCLIDYNLTLAGGEKEALEAFVLAEDVVKRVYSKLMS